MKVSRVQRSELEAAQAEMERCLCHLVPLFDEPDFRTYPPEVVLDTGPRPVEPPETGSRVLLYTRSDFAHPPEELLAILLHKTVHAFHAFRWEQDCTWGSYHTRRFRAQAQQVGLQVGWMGRRRGWAHTVATPRLRRLFQEIGLSQEVLAFAQRWRRRLSWDCGSRCFPSRDDLAARLGRRRRDRRRIVRSVRVHRRTSSPLLRLSGGWLGAFGFHEGVRVKVEARYGRLTMEAWPGTEDRR